MSSRHAGNARAAPRPRKALGQHFLTDPALLARIADALAAGPADTVVEIGPGRGALTERLLERAGRVVAIELDPALVALLRQRFASEPRLVVVAGDVLQLRLADVVPGRYLLAGNIPYYITTPILFHALQRPRPERAIFLVQREVAERMVSPPGRRAYGALSANLQALARVELLFRVAAGAFHPAPTVESAVVRVTPREDVFADSTEEARYRTFVQEVFSFRRKQMRRALRTILGLDAESVETLLVAAGIDPVARPETLAPDAFARLLDGISTSGHSVDVRSRRSSDRAEIPRD